MSQAVSTHDASRESFARILNRLAHAPSDSLLADDDAVRVSISERGAALNQGSKRTLAPARAIKQSATRSHADANEISYERALRLHSRPRPVQPPIAEISSAAESPAAGNDLPPKAIPLRKAASPSADAMSSKATAKQRRPAASEGKKEKAKKPATPSASVQPKSPKAATPAQPKRHARAKKPTSHAAGILQGNAPRRSSAARQTSSQNASPNRKDHAHSDASSIAPGSSAASSTTLASSTSQNAQLELASQITALAQRQTIVSIRVNAIESEQLRQRAAESGISVSAYMRSCVLEAEHLRAQVKQALAEMRASQALITAQSSMTEELTLVPPSLAHRPISAVRTGLAGFFSGIFACVLGRLHR